MFQKTFVEGRFKERHFQWIVLFTVNTEIFDFVQWNRLIFDRFVFRFVPFGIRSECADVHFTRRYRSCRINLNTVEEMLSKQSNRIRFPTTIATNGS